MTKNQYTCVKCGKLVEEKNVCVVDNNHICVNCMYQGHEPFEVFPIGFVRNKQTRGDNFGLEGKEEISMIELFDSQKPFMYRLEDEKHLMIIYQLHESRMVRSVFKRGMDGKEVGIFASRTPDRLSRLAVKNVELVDIKGTTLFVKQFDAINGSPILDIKIQMKGY
ncbi:MAG: TrmO family methyltransferase [Methanosarcinaceae archaeon]|nr:TrmO family methyltransferase [Methanosarcinaceae archaeon]